MAIRIDGAICLHIPKTGGTFVRNYFRDSKMILTNEELELSAHINAGEIRRIIGHTEDLIFCFVRHPLTWYRSYWESKQQITDRRGGYIDGIVDLPWIEFLNTILRDRPGYLTEFYEGYTNICRFIGKQENLREDLNTVLRFLRIPYNKDFLFKRPSDNVVPSNKKYTKDLAFSFMEAEKVIVKKYDYNYLPMEVI
jgi:hypothetical protein